MPEQTEQQENQTASIVRSVEFMQKMMISEGVFSYLPASKEEPEQTITFDAVMSDCADKSEFIAAVFGFYKEWKKHFAEQTDNGKSILTLVDAIDTLVLEHANFAAHDEHGIEL